MSIPSHIKAIGIDKTGGPEVIQLKEIPTPEVGDEQVLIKVDWAGINFIDTYFRGGLYPIKTPFILGNEVAGTVAALGSAVDSAKHGYKVGDRVAGYVPGGGLAQYVATAPGKVTKLPDGVSNKDAATLLLQGLTAITAVKESHEVKKGEYILVHAAAGGLGLLLVQLAAHFGAHVIGTTSTEAKAKLAKENGAEHVVLYGEGQPPVPEQVLKLTDGKGVHAVYDGVGKTTFEGNFDSVRRKGTIVSIGNASGAVPPFQPLKLGAKNHKLLRPRLDNYIQDLDEWQHYTALLWQLQKEGAIRIAVHSEEGYPFTAEGIKQAHEDLAGRKTTGKLIVHVDQS